LNPTIYWTKVDEAPALATYSLFPIVRSFVALADIKVDVKDISLAGRILAAFSDKLESKFSDDLAELGELTQNPDTVIIKLPNISASIPQLEAAIKELQEKGFDIPNYPNNPQNDEEKAIQLRYAKILGSAVNPVLREGNSDRRAPRSVKTYAKKYPHSMGEWKKDSKTRVAHMESGDFYGSEQSVTIPKATSVSIEFESASGKQKTLKKNLQLLDGEIIDASCMSYAALVSFYKTQIQKAKEEGVLLSLHLKATMMKVSDPIMFGAAVRAYFESVFQNHSDAFTKAGINPNHGLGAMIQRINQLDENQKSVILGDIQKTLKTEAPLAMVDSDKGVTNLHVPSDVIVDASMPAMIRSGGKMWNSEGKMQDTLALIPDRCYAKVYAVAVEDCKQNGALNPATMGTVPNVGLMAQKAEEYGSHDKTFQIEEKGVVRVIDSEGKILMSHNVEAGDIWRMCQTKDEPIKDWVKLAVSRAKESGMPAIFWLDSNRAHDAQIINKVKTYLSEHDTTNLEISIMTPEEATKISLTRMREGKDTISVTGNVLRDYNTDLFPILELGTSAKMLSIVPLMKGGGLFETGAGGSAPKHVQQFLKENHLRWDSLGEFMALAAALEHIGNKANNNKAKLLAIALDGAIGKFLDENRSPSRKCGEIDNRGSHAYLALYWLQALRDQKIDSSLACKIEDVVRTLENEIDSIINELNLLQGKEVDIGGYYLPNDTKANNAIRPIEKFNEIIDSICRI
jgi:isocitrate dehydrogenase